MRTDELIRAMAADTAPRRPVGPVLAATMAGARARGRRRRAGGARGRTRPRRDDDQAADAAAAGVPRCCWRSARRCVALRLARPGAGSGPTRLHARRRGGARRRHRAARARAGAGRRLGAGRDGRDRRACLAVGELDRAAAARRRALGARAGARSTRPRASGALAGLLAGAIAAAIYALHCTETSPLFYAIWYGLAILAVTAARRGARAAAPALVAGAEAGEAEQRGDEQRDGRRQRHRGGRGGGAATGGPARSIRAIAASAMRRCTTRFGWISSKKARRRPCRRLHGIVVLVEAGGRRVAHAVAPRVRRAGRRRARRRSTTS